MASERIQRQIDRFLDEAEEAVAQGDWSVVSDRANKVLALDPDNADARTYMAAAHRAQGGPGDGAALPSGPASASPTAAPITAGHPNSPRPDNIGVRTSFANGRYQVDRLLGEGGKKRVYLAHDTPLDREVAFALIKTEGLDEKSRTRIQREAQAMGRLGSHPHIVTVFDLGEESVSGDGAGESQTRPYMVTELNAGGDVEGLIEKADDHRLPLE